MFLSNNFNIEIIVVDNSPTQDFEFEGVKVIKTEPYHIPKGYNTGVFPAEGKFVALFHDDCMVKDDYWIEKLTTHLDNEVIAVSPEDAWNHQAIDDIVYLKEVPLVMERDKFLELGGYDETYYFGYEDVELADKIMRAGKKIMEVPDVKYTHFNGMSTILMNCEPELENYYREVFGKKEFVKDEIFQSLKQKYMKRFWESLQSFSGEEELEIAYMSWIELTKKMPQTKEEVNDIIRIIKEY